MPCAYRVLWAGVAQLRRYVPALHPHAPPHANTKRCVRIPPACHLGPESGVPLAQALRGMPELQVLDIRDSTYTDGGPGSGGKADGGVVA